MPILCSSPVRAGRLPSCEGKRRRRRQRLTGSMAVPLHAGHRSLADGCHAPYNKEDTRVHFDATADGNDQRAQDRRFRTSHNPPTARLVTCFRAQGARTRTASPQSQLGSGREIIVARCAHVVRDDEGSSGGSLTYAQHSLIRGCNVREFCSECFCGGSRIHWRVCGGRKSPGPILGLGCPRDHSKRSCAATSRRSDY